MNRWVTLALALTALAAMLLRWPQPGQRPMHNDEAVNGLKFAQLWEQREYRYDPNEHHGPSLYYFTSFISGVTGGPASASGISEIRLRWITVLFGIALICPLALLVDGLGRAGTLWACLLAAISPAFVFYSVYYIHEMLLVFFAAATFVCAWRYWRSRKVVWVILCGLSFGLMAATKETFVISAGAAGIALLLNQGWNRYLDATGAPTRAPKLNPWHMAAGAATALFTAALFFSSFLKNPAGPVDAIRTYEPWLARAGGDSPHLHPWYFYAQRLLWFHPPKSPFWSEGIILVLASVGTFAGFSRKGLGDSRGSLIRFLALYSFCLAGLYSIIPYKTPWCLLNFWHGFILLAGAGAAWLIRNIPKGWRQTAMFAAILAGCAQLAVQAARSVNEFGADRKNPYVYAQTLPDALRLITRVDELAKHGQGVNALVKVIAPDSDYWPLPWYLRKYNQIGWYEALPNDPYASIMIVSAKLDARLDEKGTHLMAGYFELRPSVFLELYVEVGLWKKYLAERL